MEAALRRATPRARRCARIRLRRRRAGDEQLPAETREKLASLGYVSSAAAPRLRADAPSPRRMTPLFDDLDRASGLFARGEYAAALPAFERIVAADPHNPMAAVYLAVAHSMLDHDADAERWFRRAAAVAPDSLDLRHYQALHECKNARWARAEPLLERVLAAQPDRVPALACLAEVRAHQGRRGDAIALLERVVAQKGAPAAELLRLGELRMEGGDTDAAIAAFERARALQGERFAADLELGVLYLAARRFDDAARASTACRRAALAQPMALFKRAQVSVLLGEADRGERARRRLPPPTRRRARSSSASRSSAACSDRAREPPRKAKGGEPAPSAQSSRVDEMSPPRSCARRARS